MEVAGEMPGSQEAEAEETFPQVDLVGMNPQIVIRA
jgi:hypothetical protein